MNIALVFLGIVVVSYLVLMAYCFYSRVLEDDEE